jgi:small redox-active disulfide protein 2
MLEIKILGPGCARCLALEKLTGQAVAELQLKADIEKITAIDQIIKYRILSTPALVINGKVKSAGRLPSKEDIKHWLKEESLRAQAEDS